MTTCHGCNQPLEPLATTRTYHSGCDPWSRMEMLEGKAQALLDALSRVPDVATLAGVEIEDVCAALAYKPAQMKGRAFESKLSRIQELALEAQDDLERRFLESAMRLLVEIENLTRPDNG